MIELRNEIRVTFWWIVVVNMVSMYVLAWIVLGIVAFTR